MVEFVDQQHEQFIYPAVINDNACYLAPTAPGYSTELKPESVSMYEYPIGSEWQKMFAGGIFKKETY